jgi:gamma-glutamyl:cysteine ligase YbdK (ATP-grasp superfamily)
MKTYKTLEVLGPEHEFSVVNEKLEVLPIVDKIIKDYYGRLVNFVKQADFTFGKELQLHVMEIKANKPFRSPEKFEETMYKAVLSLLDFLESRYKAHLLGTGMHPLLQLKDTRVWPHRHRQIYQAYDEIFNLKQHGWLNIQSFHLNIPYKDEKTAILIHNILTNVIPYLPAITSSSPIYEGKIGEYIDNRMFFYMESQKKIPSIVGKVIPEYVFSFKQYRNEIIRKYSTDLEKAGANKCLLNKEWVNSRGIIIRFDRKALEVRIMDEQECIKSDVALSCFLRALLRGLIRERNEILPRKVLFNNFKSIIKEGLNAKVFHPKGHNARKICQELFQISLKNASQEEKKYLSIIQKRIEKGNLSEIIRERVLRRAQKTDFKEAIIDVYSQLLNSLRDNQPFF